MRATSRTINDWPYSRDLIDEMAHGLDASKKRRIFCENAGRLYGFLRSGERRRGVDGGNEMQIAPGTRAVLIQLALAVGLVALLLLFGRV